MGYYIFRYIESLIDNDKKIDKNLRKITSTIKSISKRMPRYLYLNHDDDSKGWKKADR